MSAPLPLRALAGLTLGLALGAGPTVAVAAPAVAGAVSVYGVSYDAEKGALVIKASGPVQPKVIRLEAPRRMVVDLPGTVLRPAYQQLDGVPGTGVTRIRVGQYLASTTRVVLELGQPVTLEAMASGNEVWIPLKPGGQTASVPTPAPAATPRPAQDPTIRAIAYQQGGFTVIQDRLTPYWSHTRAGSTIEYTVVWPRTRLSPEVATAPHDTNAFGIVRWQAAQVGPDAHLTIEMTRSPAFDISSAGLVWQFRADRQAVAVRPTPAAATPTPAPPRPSATPRPATPKPTPSAAVVHVKPSATPKPNAGTIDEPAWPGAPDAPLALRHVDNRWQLMLTADARFTYKTTAVGDDRLHVDITGARVALPRDSVYIDNGLIARVRVQPHGERTTRLTIDLDQPVRHVARLMGNQRSLLIGLGRVTKDRVTVDPGHGGSDTGTVGTKGTREKDVTLQIATRLARVMEANGMSVQMTRMKDLEILLRPRVEMANRNDADVFVSIHANSFGNQHGVEGIETYYFTDESYPLAKAIHKQLLKSLNQPDRGVRKNNFYVVHHTQMPAALIEIGYLSNPHEETLLASAAYQEKAAQAIYTGIRDFLAERKPKP